MDDQTEVQTGSVTCLGHMPTKYHSRDLNPGSCAPGPPAQSLGGSLSAFHASSHRVPAASQHERSEDFYGHFTDAGTEVQTGSGSCPRSRLAFGPGSYFGGAPTSSGESCACPTVPRSPIDHSGLTTGALVATRSVLGFSIIL